jgi:hypothetical protein
MDSEGLISDRQAHHRAACLTRCWVREKREAVLAIEAAVLPLMPNALLAP